MAGESVTLDKGQTQVFLGSEVVKRAVNEKCAATPHIGNACAGDPDKPVVYDSGTNETCFTIKYVTTSFQSQGVRLCSPLYNDEFKSASAQEVEDTSMASSFEMAFKDAVKELKRIGITDEMIANCIGPRLMGVDKQHEGLIKQDFANSAAIYTAAVKVKGYQKAEDAFIQRSREDYAKEHGGNEEGFDNILLDLKFAFATKEIMQKAREGAVKKEGAK